MFRSLSVRNYRLYAGGQVVSITGTWMARVTQDWLVYHILTNDSSFALGLVTALQFMPTLLFGMYGGILGDRYPKRRVLIATQSAMAVISLVSGLLIVTDVLELWSMCLIVFVFGVVTALDSPVRQAFVVEMVGRETLQNAVSLNSATFNLARMIGPAIAGVMIEAFGTAPAFFCNTVSYVAVIVGLLAMTTGDLQMAQRVARARGQLREGIDYVRQRSQLLLPLTLIGIIAMFGFNFQITNALMAQGVFGRGAGAYGALSTVQALGALIGALSSARRRERPRIRLLISAAVAFGVLEAVSSVMPTYDLFMLLLLPTGLAAIFLTTSANAAVQLATSPRMQSRVMALYTMVFLGCAPLGSLFVGWLGGTLGPRAALFFGGAISVVGALACAAMYARSERVELRFNEHLWRIRVVPREELAREQAEGALVADVQAR